MTRRNNPKDAWMPPRVYRGKSAYEYHPKTGGALKICSLTEANWFVLKTFEELLSSLEIKNTLAGLIDDFFQSADFLELSPTTQKDYKKYSIKVVAVMGKANPHKIERKHIRKYMDKRGIKSKVQANREKAFLSRCYRWALERDIVTKNPCTGVRAFKEQARRRYIENWEYETVYNFAAPHIKVAMEISYLCAARKGDVLAMTWAQISSEGIYIKQGKTGVEQIKAWSPRLEKAIELAKQARTGNIISRWVISQPSGKSYTERGFDQGWIDARAAARKESGLALDFTFHDIKAKSVSDYEGSSKDKQQLTGHKTESQVAAYDRKLKVTPTLGS